MKTELLQCSKIRSGLLNIHKKRILTMLLSIFLIFLIIIPVAASQQLPETSETAAVVSAPRPSVNGRLHVAGPDLVDESGTPVQLRGVSTHGLTWFPRFINEDLFSTVSQDWNAGLVRLAMYSSEYCGDKQEESLALMKRGIDAAIAADMYAIVDWHILEDADPNIHTDEAAAFFELIASEYADCPNLIFEICNEPNSGTGWSAICDYSSRIIPIIRKHIPDAVILVGTPEFDRNLSCAILRPLEFDNVMYVLHFYTASHSEDLTKELRLAVDAKLPVFISECGLSEASGSGTLDFDSAAVWFSYLNEHQISYAVWSLSNKAEASAFFHPNYDPANPPEDKDLTLSGTWVRSLLREKDPYAIEYPSGIITESGKDSVISLITNSLGKRGFGAIEKWLLFAAAAIALFMLFALMAVLYLSRRKKVVSTYDRFYKNVAAEDVPEKRTVPGKKKSALPGKIILIFSILLTIIYLCWRIFFSVPVQAGVLAVIFNILLLIVEIVGFAESLVLFWHMLKMKDHPLPEIPEEMYPEVDIFIATYNEPEELLRRTLNGCNQIDYPDRSKVHIWLCDDNRRPSMRALAEEMGVGYFDRPDNKGAKAGNLNHAFSLTSAPYIVTLDADMIPKSDFLLKTIPYFIDMEIRNQSLPPEKQAHLGFLQTPQCFYDPDVFQHALYSEKTVPNEQDFFYRTIEPSKTSTNSVIYGGSNTVLSRRAIEDIGGFYTESITEDFATGLLIEAKGYLSLSLPEPLASGQTPHTYKEHIQQRTRWGRGVIVTAKKLKIFHRKTLSLPQKLSYWSSVIYWYSPVKSLIYMISPLLFSTFAIPVFNCNWLELMVFWLPMFIMQDISLRVNSKKKISSRWSGIYETSLMPHLLIPILKEAVGISLTTFKVTDKSKKTENRKKDIRSMIPFLILAAFSVGGIIRLICIFDISQLISILILAFWIFRNLYFIIMSIFLVDGRDSNEEDLRVVDAVPVILRNEDTDDKKIYEGVTTLLTEHSLSVYLDEDSLLTHGTRIFIELEHLDHKARIYGVITGKRESRKKNVRTWSIEILDYCNTQYEYWGILYDRIPTLPQSLYKNYGSLEHLWQNIAHRVSRTIK